MCVATAARIASPSAPPTCWAVLTSPEASPAWSGRIPVTAAIVTDTNENPRPTAASSDGPSTSPRYVPPGHDTCENHASPAATKSMPVVSTILKPMRVTSTEATPALTMIVSASGR